MIEFYVYYKYNWQKGKKICVKYNYKMLTGSSPILGKQKEKTFDWNSGLGGGDSFMRFSKKEQKSPWVPVRYF